jgi:hypothetical protein
MEATRRLGQMMQQQKETIGLNRGGRPKTGIRGIPVSDQLPTLADVGIGKNLAHEARSTAAMSHEEFQAAVKAKREGLRTRTGSRVKSLDVEARAPTQRAGSRGRKHCTNFEKWLSQISTVCRYDGKVEILSELGAPKIDAAIATIAEVIGELKKTIDRLEEARPQK